ARLRGLLTGSFLSDADDTSNGDGNCCRSSNGQLAVPNMADQIHPQQPRPRPHRQDRQPQGPYPLQQRHRTCRHVRVARSLGLRAQGSAFDLSPGRNPVTPTERPKYDPGASDKPNRRSTAIKPYAPAPAAWRYSPRSAASPNSFAHTQTSCCASRGTPGTIGG